MPNSLKSRLKKLSLNRKFILGGSLVAAIGVFLPWYRDIDQFNTGDMFLGITGPLYLAGLIVLLASIASFGIVFLTVLEKPLPKLPLKKDHFHLLNSVLSVFMLVLALSVFFHHKFGYSLVDKSVGVGIILAFIGSFLVMIGAVSSIKKKGINFEEKGSLEPLINIDERERNNSDLDRKIESAGEPIEARNAVQESIEDFTNGKSDTNDVHIND